MYNRTINRLLVLTGNGKPIAEPLFGTSCCRLRLPEISAPKLDSREPLEPSDDEPASRPNAFKLVGGGTTTTLA